MKKSAYRIVLPVLMLLALPVASLNAGTLTLNGEGVVSYAPDAAHFMLSTQTRADTASAARAAASDRVAAWEEAIGKLRKSLKDYDDSQVTVTEAPEYDDNGRPTDKRFFLASQTIRFDLTDLDRLNQVISAAEKADLSYSLDPDSYYSTRSDEHDRAALAAALEDAQTRCDFVAVKLDLKCGAVETLRVFDQGDQPRPMMMSMDARRETVSKISERETRASVEATFKLE